MRFVRGIDELTCAWWDPTIEEGRGLKISDVYNCIANNLWWLVVGDAMEEGGGIW